MRFLSGIVLSGIVLCCTFVSQALYAAEPTVVPVTKRVDCDGTYKQHLQGIATDGQFIYWSFTTKLVKTLLDGHIVVQVKAPSHQGDLCYHEGKIYVAVNRGVFNQETGAKSFVYVYKADDLVLLSTHDVPELVHGAGGMDWSDGYFYVIGGLPEGRSENYVYQYTPEFKFVKRHVVPSGYTLLGIQTACYAHGFWWFGCYGQPAMLQCDKDFKVLDKTKFAAAVGLAVFPDGSMISGRNKAHRDPETEKVMYNTGWVLPAKYTSGKGLSLVNKE